MRHDGGTEHQYVLENVCITRMREIGVFGFFIASIEVNSYLCLKHFKIGMNNSGVLY